MIKEAIQYIKELGINPKDREVSLDGRTFVVDDRGHAEEIRPVVYRAEDIVKLNTLTGLVDYIKSEKERADRCLFVQVVNEFEVKLYGILDELGGRELLIKTRAIVPQFNYGQFHDTEELIINLQSKFVRNKDADLLLKVVGNIKEENVKDTGDNGYAQAVTMKTGIATVGSVKVPNPATLAPYRTFLEVEQPESSFVFRMKDGPRGAIFEADGGAWRNEAIRNIKGYLEQELKSEVKSGRITVIA